MPAGHTPVTFASVLKIANENMRREKSEELSRLLNLVRTSNDEDEITGKLARELMATITTDLQYDVDFRVGATGEARERGAGDTATVDCQAATCGPNLVDASASTVAA